MSTRSDLRNNMTSLQRLAWIDRFTSAVFVEFATYNPNVNLFASCSIIFELLPTGGILKTIDINTISVIDLSLGLESGVGRACVEKTTG
jgi:hypothetical protein